MFLCPFRRVSLVSTDFNTFWRCLINTTINTLLQAGWWVGRVFNWLDLAKHEKKPFFSREKGNFSHLPFWREQADSRQSDHELAYWVGSHDKLCHIRAQRMPGAATKVASKTCSSGSRHINLFLEDIRSIKSLVDGFNIWKAVLCKTPYTGF